MFGCVCYVHNQKHGGDKFENRGNKSIFIGYPFAKKGWRVYNIETGRVTVSRDVVFLETEFGFSSLPISVTPTELLEQIPPVDLFEPEHMLTEIASPAPINLDASTSSGVNESDSAVTPDASSQPIPLPVVDAETISVSTDTRQDTVVITEHAPEPSVSSPAEVISLPEPELLGRGMRPKKQPTRLADYVANLIHDPQPSTTPYPLDNYLSSEQFSENYQAFLGIILSTVEPRS